MELQRERLTKVQIAKERLRKEIKIGNFARGASLPSERDLAEQFGVSYMTMRKAVGGLVSDGILERSRGSGTYVCEDIAETKLQKLLGLVMPAWAAPENLDFIMHISEACAKANWLVKIIYVRSWEERSILDLWQNCDALACTAPTDPHTLSEPLIKRIRSRLKPMVFCGLDARTAHLDAQQPFYELLRRHRFFEVVVDAEEADYLVVFVADEDAAAFDELAAVVFRKVVEYALAALIFLRLEHEQAEVRHRASFAASRDVAVLAEHERALRYRNVVKVHLVISAEYLREPADYRD